MKILKNTFIKKYLVPISVFILIGFSTCILHVDDSSDISHGESGNHHESPINNITCIDNLTYSRTSINAFTDFTEVVFLNDLNEISVVNSLNPDSHQFFPITKPPNDGIALYMKNNMYRI